MKRDTIQHKPLTEQMISTLMDIHERELMQLEPKEASGNKSAQGLLLRQMPGTKDYVTGTGKRMVVLYLTAKGKAF